MRRPDPGGGGIGLPETLRIEAGAAGSAGVGDSCAATGVELEVGLEVEVAGSSVASDEAGVTAVMGCDTTTGSAATGVLISIAGATGAGACTGAGAAAVPPDRTTRDVRAGATSLAGLVTGATGSGFTSTIGSRRSPSSSARRRARSADGSSMLDEWLFTPILSSSQSSSTT